MMRSGTGTHSFGRLAIGAALSALALAACSKQADQPASDPTAAANTAAADVATANAVAATGAPAAPAADNVDTVSGVKYASYTGVAAAGKTVFIACQTCHAVEAGVNKIGPSLAGIVGRKASTIAGYTYSQANLNSGITWTPEKLFQYLENPQRVVPGTKMAFAGLPDPQKRADVIAYLQNPS